MDRRDGDRCFFFRQVGAVRSYYRPQYDALQELVTAQEKAGASSYSERWGVLAELDHAAEFMPILRAKFGPRRDVTEYPTWQVLQTMTMATDRQRLSDLINKAYKPAK